jgi:hypothetical protein
VIKAYHMVGSGDWSEEERIMALHEIMSVGEITPAIMRMDRCEMESECFAGEATEVITKKFGKATPKAKEAIKEIVEERLEELPDSGLTHSLFNCGDFLVGDLDLIFLRPGGWYDVPNGFVYDSEELFGIGARFRPDDLGRDFYLALGVVVKQKYRSVKEARREIEAMINLVKAEREYSGSGVLPIVEACLKGRGICRGDMYEIVVPGALPTAMAIEIWEEGKRIR